MSEPNFLLTRTKVEGLFNDWVILIEFNNAIIQARNIREYFIVKTDMKLSKQTISERATDLINLSIANCNELSKLEERNKLPT